jgi:hypothetical protein
VRSDDERLRDIVEHAELIGAHLPASRDELDKDVVLAAALDQVGRNHRGGGRAADRFLPDEPSGCSPRVAIAACATILCTGTSHEPRDEAIGDAGPAGFGAGRQ